MRGKQWTKEEDDRLREAVSRHGCAWTAIARELGWTTISVKRRWPRIAGRVEPLSRPAGRTVRSRRVACTNAPDCEWPAFEEQARDRTGGRPWSHHVSHGPTPSREPSRRQLQMLRAWGLDCALDEIFVCNLKRAEGAVVRYYKTLDLGGMSVNDAVTTRILTPAERSQLKLACGPTDVLHTFTSSNANLHWVCGPKGRRGFLTLSELTFLMGLDRKRLLPALRRTGVCDSTLFAWVAEAVQGRMSMHCADIVLEAFPRKRRWTVGSLYAGAADSLPEGLVRRGADVQRVFAAERHPKKRGVLKDAFGA